MENKKEFYIDTPIGKLHVYEKPDIDYVGIYVDLVRPDIHADDNLVCCVEYDKLNERIQTVTYKPGEDEPTDIIVNYEEG